MTGKASKVMQEFKEHGNKIRGFYWTLGRYDTVVIFEAPNEKVAMELSIEIADIATTETMVAVTREEAHKLL
jgi:uncharacterized protein with GYD domain